MAMLEDNIMLFTSFQGKIYYLGILDSTNFSFLYEDAKKKSYSNMKIFKIIISIYPSWIKKGLSKTLTKAER